MAARNTGKASEAIFEARYRKQGKKCFVYRFRDVSDLFAMNGGRKIKLPPLPSDYLITLNGDTFYAEVKSTIDPKAFRLAMVSKDQWAAAMRITKAHGSYWVFIHRLNRDVWYKVPFSMLQITRDAGIASMKWDELEMFRWDL